MNPNSTRSDEQISLSILLKFIKPYNGDTEKLSALLTNCNTAMNLADDTQILVVFAYIQCQLVDKAEAACVNHIFDDYEELKNFLKRMYSEKKHYNHLLIELQQCRQLHNESVSQYIFKIESCLKRLLTVIRQNNQTASELPGKIAAMNDLALHTYILGVSSPIGQIRRSRDIRDLNEAFVMALEEEKIKNYLKLNNTRNCSTGICHKSGYTSSQCYKNKRHPN